MKIYIEAGSFYGKRTGVGRYGLCVSQALARLRTQDKLTYFSFLKPGRSPEIDFPVAPNARFKFIRWFPGRAFSLLMRHGIAIPMELFGLWRADFFIFPNFIVWSALLPKKRIMVVHDVSFLYYPEFIQAKNLAYLRSQLGRSLRRSTKVIAVSEATRQDLLKEYDLPPDKVGVVYNAVDHAIFNPQASQQTEAVRQQFDIPERYMLFVSSIEPRKNLEGLLQAYEQSYPKHKAALVIVGGGKQWSWNAAGIDARFKRLSHLPIIRTGFIDDGPMAALYAGALAFVYPSFYEGFGIPVLEAMASGCPVICSNIPPHQEIIGNAAISVAPKDIKDLAQAMTTVLADAKLRQKLGKAGVKQAAQFSWEYSAEQLSEILDGLL